MSPLESLKAGFRRACVRRLAGDRGAVNVLKSEIPGLVVNWAKTSSLEAFEKSKLKELSMMSRRGRMYCLLHLICLLVVLRFVLPSR